MSDDRKLNFCKTILFLLWRNFLESLSIKTHI